MIGTPLLCLVTDRRRLAVRRGRPVAEGDDLVVAQVEAAAASGVSLIIVREHDLDARSLRRLTTRIVDAVRGTPARVLVNDRLDVALAGGAHGVHLRATSIPPTVARRLTSSGFLVGRSVHSLEEAEGASGADYLVAGTIFPTASKPATIDLLGINGLARIAAAVSVPVLGIGGIDSAGRVRQVVAAGGGGVAVIGGLQPGSETGDLRAGVQDCVTKLRSGFDFASSAS